jgi:hypothetical protein
MSSGSTQPARSTLIDYIAARRKPSAHALFLIALVCAVVALWLGIAKPTDYSPFCFAAAVLALANLCAGLYQYLRDPEDWPEPESTRLLVLAVAGFWGLIITGLGAALAWTWWDTYLEWMRGEPGKDAWRLWASLLAVFGGLVLMFAGLQLARGEERANPILRRLLYGYNSFLAAILLLTILLFANVLAYAKFNTPIDFTASNIYTLTSRSKSVLEGLNKQTKIYVILRPASMLQLEVQNVLNNCRAINPRIEVQYIDPDLDEEKIRDLQSQASFTARMGILIVYGPSSEHNTRFITADDLFTADTMGTREMKFKGEDAIMSALSALAEGKSKPVIYFTQGHGELDLDNFDDARMGVGAGDLKSRLEKRNYEVKPLRFKPADPRVPDDASIVVMVGPKEMFSPQAVQALRSYVNPERPGAKKGKLVVFFDIALSPEGTMRQTGLEPFMREFGVDVGNDRILSVRVKDPLTSIGIMNPSERFLERNPVARTFAFNQFRLYNPREVRPIETPRAGGRSNFTAGPFIYLLANLWLIRDSNLRGSASELASSLLKNQSELAKRVSEEAIPVACVVTSPQESTDPHSMMMPNPGEGTPRLAVFGSAALASNYFTSERRGQLHYELIANTLDWLRERPQSIGIEPKKRDFFVLDPSVNVNRMRFLPAGLMLLAIIGLGTSVWLVRRQ